MLTMPIIQVDVYLVNTIILTLTELNIDLLNVTHITVISYLIPVFCLGGVLDRMLPITDSNIDLFVIIP